MTTGPIHLIPLIMKALWVPATLGLVFLLLGRGEIALLFLGPVVLVLASMSIWVVVLVSRAIVMARDAARITVTDVSETPDAIPPAIAHVDLELRRLGFLPIGQIERPQGRAATATGTTNTPAPRDRASPPQLRTISWPSSSRRPGRTAVPSAPPTRTSPR